MSGVAAALDDVLDHIDDDTPVVHERSKPYVTAIPATQLFTDPSYQRPLDDMRVSKMVEDYDETLLGVLEVSTRDDSRFAIVDGGHRCAAARLARGPDVHLVGNVHRGLTVEQEAQLFYEIDTRRRALTGWDRWWSRRGMGDPVVRDIEQIAGKHELRIGPYSADRTIRATRSCEKIVEEGGTSLLDATLSLAIRSFGTTVDCFDGPLLHGLALVVHHYATQVDVDRLIAVLQEIPPRQLKARAHLLREVQKGTEQRLIASVVIERYNTSKGPKLTPFTELVALRPAKQTPSPQARRNTVIREWARNNGYPIPPKGHLTAKIRGAYEAAVGVSGGGVCRCLTLTKPPCCAPSTATHPRPFAATTGSRQYADSARTARATPTSPPRSARPNARCTATSPTWG